MRQAVYREDRFDLEKAYDIPCQSATRNNQVEILECKLKSPSISTDLQ